jgi:hypothetical protein
MSRAIFLAPDHDYGRCGGKFRKPCRRAAVRSAPCGSAGETLETSPRAAGFSPKSPVIEIAGICSRCRER